MNDTIVKIGERIQTRRKELNLSQEELGDRLALNKSTIARYENGTIKKIKIPVLQAMARILDVNPDWLALKTDIQGTYADCSESGNISSKVTADDIKFALFGTDGEITDAMFEEVKNFANYVKQREAQKNDENK